MMRFILNCLAAAISALSIFAGFSSLAQSPAGPFTVTSPALYDGGVLDKRFAGPNDSFGKCGGESISPPLQWSNAPTNTKSFAVIVFDLEGANGNVVHWIAYGIASDVTSLAEGEGNKISSRFVSGSNNRGWATYWGPCAPATDHPHHYMFSVYALDVPKDELPTSLTRDQFIEKIKGRVLKVVSIESLYKRP